MTTFKENVTIITGASSGIGYALALKLAEQGAWLTLAARSEDKLNALAVECRAAGGRALVVRTDIAEQDQCQNLIKRTVEEYGRIDTLYNNAGITIWAKFEEMKVLDPFEKVMRVNYFGGLYCTHYALPHLKETQGRIVAVSSLAGRTGVPYRSGYSASKFAMAGFFETIRIELAPYGISVTMIYPDFVQTNTRLKAFGPDGEPLKSRPMREGKRMMTANQAADQIIKTVGKRKRELIMSTRGKLGSWVKLIAPGLIDKIATRAVEKGK